MPSLKPLHTPLKRRFASATRRSFPPASATNSDRRRRRVCTCSRCCLRRNSRSGTSSFSRCARRTRRSKVSSPHWLSTTTGWKRRTPTTMNSSATWPTTLRSSARPTRFRKWPRARRRSCSDSRAAPRRIGTSWRRSTWTWWASSSAASRGSRTAKDCIWRRSMLNRCSIAWRVASSGLLRIHKTAATSLRWVAPRMVAFVHTRFDVVPFAEPLVLARSKYLYLALYLFLSISLSLSISLYISLSFSLVRCAFLFEVFLVLSGQPSRRGCR